MPLPIHLKVEGSKQGPIDGPCKMKNREKTILIQAFNHQVTMDRNMQTGTSTGKRLHEPIKIVKEVDDTSPKLYLALTTGEHLKLEIKWYRPHPDGGAGEQHYFTTKVEDAVITSIRPYIPLVFDPNNGFYTHMEEVQFTYRKIIWTFVPGGVESEDDWLAPVEK